MAFGIEINRMEKNAGEMVGRQVEVACECWFTSSGSIRPLMIKFQDEEGEIQTIRELFIHSTEEKNYVGIASVEFDITLIFQGRRSRVRLIYFKEECRWVILTGESK